MFPFGIILAAMGRQRQEESRKRHEEGRPVSPNKREWAEIKKTKKKAKKKKR